MRVENALHVCSSGNLVNLTWCTVAARAKNFPPAVDGLGHCTHTLQERMHHDMIQHNGHQPCILQFCGARAETGSTYLRETFAPATDLPAS